MASEAMRRTKEIRSLTGIRGVAALYVVLLHYFSGTGTGAKIMFLKHGYIAVDLFFVLSGFVMAMNYQRMFAAGFSFASYLLFLKRRIARIYPIYFVTTVAALVLIYLGLNRDIKWSVAPDKIWAVKFLINALLIQAWGIANSINLPAWSLSSEWAAYLVFPALLIPCLFRTATIAWCFAAFSMAVIVAIAFCPWHEKQPIDLGTLLTGTVHYGLCVFRCLAEFSLGLVAFRFASTPWASTFKSSRLLSPLIFAAIFGLLWLRTSDIAIVFLFPFLVISLDAGAAHVPARLLSTSLAEYLGKLSYSVYLIHVLLLPLIFYVQRQIGARGLPHGHLIGGLIAVCALLALAHLSYYLIEAPGRRLLRNLFEGRKKAAPLMDGLMPPDSPIAGQETQGGRI